VGGSVGAKLEGAGVGAIAEGVIVNGRSVVLASGEGELVGDKVIVEIPAHAKVELPMGSSPDPTESPSPEPKT
jgi:hypothetical protein